MPRVTISYAYQGSGINGHIATAAEAVNDDAKELIARAKLIEIRRDAIVVEETQYAPNGAKVYNGRLFFTRSGSKTDRTAISGFPEWDLFPDWPV